MASLCRCWFEAFFVLIKHRVELPLFFLCALNPWGVDAIFFCASRFQGFADCVSVCAEAADQSAAFAKKLRTLSK